jgi:3-deoxy-D-manno-octulosonic-acid transferase
VSRFLYTLGTIALIPWALLHLLWRARRQPDYLRHWPERFGFLPPPPPAPLIWIHAVSVGETRAAQPLVAALRLRYPDHAIVMTQMTPTGRQTAEALFGDTVARVYLPYDLPWAVGRFLAHYRPTLGLIVETEIWPNLIAAARRRQVPVLLVNARLSERSANRYAHLPTLIRETLANLTIIAAQSDEDAERLRSLGAPHVDVLGNLKFDVTPPPAQHALGEDFRRRLGSRPLFLCASTRDGEEELIIDAWRQFGCAEMLLAIVPRHPQRFDDVARLLDQRQLAWQRRSDGASLRADTRVWLGDSMGELFAYYAAADIAFVGGSLLDHGGQNLIEPCALGKPVLIGPSTYNFADAAREAVAIGAARTVGSAEELVKTACALLDAPTQRQRMGEVALAFAIRHRGATARTLALVEHCLSDL